MGTKPRAAAPGTREVRHPFVLAAVCCAGLLFVLWLPLPGNRGVPYFGQEQQLHGGGVRPWQTDYGHCGNWQQAYIKRHRDIRSGKLPPRYAVAIGLSGLADSLVGMATVFLVALLTGRAYVMAPTDNWHVKYEWAYSQPNINWTPPWPVVGHSGSGEVLNGVRGWWLDSNARDAYYDCQEIPNEHNCAPKILRGGNLSDFGEEEIIIFDAQAGYTFALFGNVYHSKQLVLMGLRPDTAFRCALDFLLAPGPAMLKQFSEEFEALSDPAVLKIGIQIRTNGAGGSDSALEENPAMAWEHWDVFFACAQQLEDAYITGAGSHGAKVLWYLISDSLDLRQQAKARFPGKLMVRTNDLSLNHTFRHGTPETFVAAAAENWLLSLCDFHIVSFYSGFGRTAGMRSPNNFQSIFVIDNHRPGHWPGAIGDAGRSCERWENDAIAKLADQWTGL